MLGVREGGGAGGGSLVDCSAPVDGVGFEDTVAPAVVSVGSLRPGDGLGRGRGPGCCFAPGRQRTLGLVLVDAGLVPGSEFRDGVRMGVPYISHGCYHRCAGPPSHRAASNSCTHTRCLASMRICA